MAPWGKDTFQSLPSSTLLNTKTNNHRKQVEDLQDCLSPPSGEASGSLRIILVHLNVATYGRILTKGCNPVVTQNLFLKDQIGLKIIQHKLENLFHML